MKKWSKPKKTLRRLPPLLRRAWFSINQAFRRRLAHLGITPDQFTILRWLHEGDRKGLTQREITDLMASDPNTITSVLNRMEKAGLLTRATHETDRRAHRICLQSRGKNVYQDALQIAISLQTQVLSVLPQKERNQFLKNLESVAQSSHAALETNQ